MNLRRIRPDPYILAILGAVLLAALLPISGGAADGFKHFTRLCIAALFFIYGARLSREAVLAGMSQWRLHLTALCVTFIAFPLIGMLAAGALGGLLGSAVLVTGLVYLGCTPSTIQSSVALVSTARGDVAAAVCTASASNLVGVFATPLLVAAILHAQGAAISTEVIGAVVLQLLLPFALGQLVHAWLGKLVERHRTPLSYFDRGTIVLLVYGAFSAAVIEGVWGKVGWTDLVVVAAYALVLFNTALFGLRLLARRMGFAVQHEIVLAFCASQKGIAAAVPMAALIFPPAEAGIILIPVLIYHQVQLIGCAIQARRYADRPGTG